MTTKILHQFEKPQEIVPYYYQKKAEPIIDLNYTFPAQDLATLVEFAQENKNPLNLAVPGQGQLASRLDVMPNEYYLWPLPFCFSWPAYVRNSTDGCTPWRIAQSFWAAMDTVRQGFKVFNAALILVPAGGATFRHADNPGGPSGPRWFSGGALRIHVPLKTNPSCVYNVGSASQNLAAGHAYEVNNLLINQVVNGGSEDVIFLDIDLVPEDKADELEVRIRSDETLNQLHIQSAAGFPIHTTLFL